MRALWPGSGVSGGTGWIEDGRVAGAFRLAMLAAVLLPIRQNWCRDKRDGFPLSYYPMFSLRRRERLSVVHLVGLTAGGKRRLIPYSYAGTGGLNQVRRQLHRLAHSGAADAVCERAARRLAAKGDGPLADVVTVQVVEGQYRLATYFAGEKEPLSERVYAARAVERT